MPESGTILSRLTSSTRRFHDDVDRPWLELLRPTVGISDYLGLLVRMYGLVAPFESACKYAPGVARIVDFRQLMRAGFIAQDLLALDLTPAQLSRLPTCPRITVFRSPQEAAGWLFVIERSTLLQDGVRRHLLRQHPHLDRACSYLASYEGRVTDQWSAFGRLLDRVGADAAAANEIIESAHNGFAVAKEWLTHARNDLRSVG